jgi:hypothetical protein
MHTLATNILAVEKKSHQLLIIVVF